MADAYSQILIQLVFAVKGRENLINKNCKEELNKYITGIVTNNKCKLLAINGMSDHIHIFVGFGTTITISELVNKIKANSTKFINTEHLTMGRFEWQSGYGAFSYSRSQMDAVVHYILNQEEHHHHKTFREEYLEFLKIFNVDFKPEYLFD
jgi:REP element-mobilizing transposase RayT